MKKKIAFVMSQLVMGGTEKVLIELLNLFDYDEYEVDLYVPDTLGELYGRVDNRVNVITEQSEDSYNFSNNITFILHCIWIKILCRITSNNYYVNSIFAERIKPKYGKKYDVAIAYRINSPFSVVGALYRIDAKRKIGWVHSDSNVTGSKITIKFFDLLYNKFEHIFCVSEDSKNRFGEKYSICRRKLEVLHNPINVQKIRELSQIETGFLPKDDISLISVMRLSSEKGVDRIVPVVKELLYRGIHVIWYIIGEGYSFDALQDEIMRNSLDNNIVLLGKKENPYPYMRMCDIYVQPSYTEGYCTTTLEAKVLCKPVVTTDVPGMREQFKNGTNGLIVESSVQGIADGIEYLVCNPVIKMQYSKELEMTKDSYDRELTYLYDYIENGLRKKKENKSDGL